MTMKHENYFEITANTTWELGLRKGELFGNLLRDTLAEEKQDRRWDDKLKRALKYLAPTAKLFPELIEEYQGYAQGASVAFEDVWTLELDEELLQERQDKCTTIVSHDGYLVSHNEDWSPDAQDAICILRRTVAGLTVFELYYLNGLGGNAMSINSHGIVHSINSLVHTDHRVGVPKKVFARLFSDTNSPDETYKLLETTPRASGYHHTLVDGTGKIWSIESSAARQVLTNPKAPFTHTNHYLAAPLKSIEGNDERWGTRHRHALASAKAAELNAVDAACDFLHDSSNGPKQSVFNRRTIASMVVDIDHLEAHVWLRRERKKGWITYALRF
jgi:hypothetical protein